MVRSCCSRTAWTMAKSPRCTSIRSSDETMIVLDGEILMHLDGTEHVVGPGGIADGAAGRSAHAFKVSGADGARLLCLHTPGCCQAFYWDASEPVAADDTRVASVAVRSTWAGCRHRQ